VKSVRSDRIRASKVAAVATTIGMGSYILIALIFNFTLIDHLTSQVDVRVAQKLNLAVKNGAQRDGTVAGSAVSDRGDLDDDSAPVFVWKVRQAARAPW
jgi:hypothetical protein